MVSGFVARLMALPVDPATSREIIADVSAPSTLSNAEGLPRASPILASELSAVTLLTEQSLSASAYTDLAASAAITSYYSVPVNTTPSSTAEDSSAPSFVPTVPSSTSTSSDQTIPVTSTPISLISSTVSQSSFSSSKNPLSSFSATKTTLLESTTNSPPTTLSTEQSSSTTTSEPPDESATSSNTAIATPRHANQTGKWMGIGLGLGIPFFLLIVAGIVFLSIRRHKRNRTSISELEHSFIGGHELALKRQAETQARTPYIPPRRKSKRKTRANLEAWKGGTVLDATEEETEKPVQEQEIKTAAEISIAEGKNDEEDEEPIRGPLKVVNPDGVSLMDADDEGDENGTTTSTAERRGSSAQKVHGDMIKSHDIGVALTR